MAYVPRLIPEDQENQFARTEATETPPVAGGSAGTGGNAAPGVGTSTQFGSNAAKLTDYLKANESQVNEFGQQVAGDLTRRYNETLGNINQGVNQFTSDVGAQYTPPDPTKVNEALQDPSTFVKNSNNVQQWQSWYNPTYSGPTNFEGTSVYSNLNDQVNKAVENAGTVGTIPGLGTYLGNNLGVTNSTPGMVNLDASLLQRNPQARENIKNAAAPYKDLSAYLGNRTTAANTAIQGEKGEIEKGRQDIQGKTKSAMDQLSSDLTDRLNVARNQAHGKADTATQNLLYGGSATPQPRLTPNDLEILGVSQDEIEPMLGALTPLMSDYGAPVDLNNFLTRRSADVVFNSPEAIATPDDVSRAQALALLSGTDPIIKNGSSGNLPDLLDLNKNGLYEATAGNLRQRDIDTLNGLLASSPAYAGMDMITAFNDPTVVDAFRRSLTGSDLSRFNNILSRMGMSSESLQNTPPPPISENIFRLPNTPKPDVSIPENRFNNPKEPEVWSPEAKPRPPAIIPEEFIYRDETGQQTGPSAGAQPYQLDYNTGEYKPIGEPIKPGDYGYGVVEKPAELPVENMSEKPVKEPLRKRPKIPGVFGAL